MFHHVAKTKGSGLRCRTFGTEPAGVYEFAVRGCIKRDATQRGRNIDKVVDLWLKTHGRFNRPAKSIPMVL